MSRVRVKFQRRQVEVSPDEANNIPLALPQLIRHTSFAEMQARDNVMGVKAAENPVMNQGVVKEDGGFFRKGEALVGGGAGGAAGSSTLPDVGLSVFLSM